MSTLAPPVPTQREPAELAERLPPVTWSSAAFYEGVYWLSMAAFTFGFSMRVRGMAHVPKRGPVLFIANHQSFLDPLLIGLAVRRPLSYLARLSLFQNRAFAWIIRMLNAVPINHEGLGIEGLRTILALLQAGRPVVVFPEGERTWDGAVHKLQPGIQLLIKRARAPIVPVGIAGAFHAWPRWRPLPVPAPLFLPAEPGTLAVSIGKPLDARHYADLPRPELLRELYEVLHATHAHAEALRRKPH